MARFEGGQRAAAQRRQTAYFAELPSHCQGAGQKQQHQGADRMAMAESVPEAAEAQRQHQAQQHSQHACAARDGGSGQGQAGALQAMPDRAGQRAHCGGIERASCGLLGQQRQVLPFDAVQTVKAARVLYGHAGRARDLVALLLRAQFQTVGLDQARHRGSRHPVGAALEQRDLVGVEPRLCQGCVPRQHDCQPAGRHHTQQQEQVQRGESKPVDGVPE